MQLELGFHSPEICWTGTWRLPRFCWARALLVFSCPNPSGRQEPLIPNRAALLGCGGGMGSLDLLLTHRACVCNTLRLPRAVSAQCLGCLCGHLTGSTAQQPSHAPAQESLGLKTEFTHFAALKPGKFKRVFGAVQAPVCGFVPFLHRSQQGSVPACHLTRLTVCLHWKVLPENGAFSGATTSAGRLFPRRVSRLNSQH